MSASATLESLAEKLAAMEKFVARRFDEISMEINATSQQIDQSEEGITRRFAEVFELLKAITFSGDGNTPANAGQELDAVVDMTEQAANRILDAAERIAGTVRNGGDWNNAEHRARVLEAIENDINEILMACSFQDITGQRIRKTLDNLKIIEERLNTALLGMGIQVPTNMDGVILKASSQSEVDDIFATKTQAGKKSA